MLRTNLFTGIQPTGRMHLGNYFGIIPHFTSPPTTTTTSSSCLSDKKNMISIVDLHSMTSSNTRIDIVELASTLLACGIDTKKTSIFIQSHVLEHCNLMWLLLCKSSLSRLNHMIQWKEKRKNKLQQHSHNPHDMGLLTYPVLQAADILLYSPLKVPVGCDQRQHLELAVELGRKFNLPPFECLIFDSKVKDLRNPHQKMSKSACSQKSIINLTDEDVEIDEKIRSAVTDSTEAIFYSPTERPTISGLLELYSLVERSNNNGAIIDVDLSSIRFSNHHQFKLALGESLKKLVRPIRKEFYSLTKDKEIVLKHLKDGKELAQEIAHSNYQKILKAATNS